MGSRPGRVLLSLTLVVRPSGSVEVKRPEVPLLRITNDLLARGDGPPRVAVSPHSALALTARAAGDEATLALLEPRRADVVGQDWLSDDPHKQPGPLE